jgi:hypothetical protein
MKSMKVMFAVLVCLALASVASAAEVWSDCVPTAVATYQGRVHVRCAASVGGGIIYFAVQTTDAAYAARFVSVASSALVAGRTLKVLYDPADLTGGSFGCATGDCRRAHALELR